MWNSRLSLEELERLAAEGLKDILKEVPVVGLRRIELEPQGPDRGVDILAHVNVAGRPHTLVCQVKSNGQPRYARAALVQLRDYVANHRGDATPIFIAPYLSAAVRRLCREYEVGFLDLEGNARLAFDSVFIERIVANKPPVERRALKSIFKRKSAQIIRLMLREPRHAWRVLELAETAEVSPGQVSNVRRALLDREWAKLEPDGLCLANPDELLDVWRDNYEPPTGKRFDLYTTLHGSAFEEASRRALSAANKGIMLASFSAAQWLAPHARIGSHFFYVDHAGFEILQTALSLFTAPKAANIIITRLEDRGLFRDSVEPVPGIVCTSPVQTYLDLTAAGERGREAADQLRREKLKWTT